MENKQKISIQTAIIIGCVFLGVSYSITQHNIQKQRVTERMEVKQALDDCLVAVSKENTRLNEVFTDLVKNNPKSEIDINKAIENILAIKENSTDKCYQRHSIN